MNHIERTLKSLADASAQIHAMLDLGEVPDGSPLASKVEVALETLYEAVDTVLAQHPTGVSDEGPLVFPVKGRDAREWPTSDGIKAGKHKDLFGGRQASGPVKLDVTERVLSAKQFRETLMT